MCTLKKLNTQVNFMFFKSLFKSQDLYNSGLLCNLKLKVGLSFYCLFLYICKDICLLVKPN